MGVRERYSVYNVNSVYKMTMHPSLASLSSPPHSPTTKVIPPFSTAICNHHSFIQQYHYFKLPSTLVTHSVTQHHHHLESALGTAERSCHSFCMQRCEPTRSHCHILLEWLEAILTILSILAQLLHSEVQQPSSGTLLLASYTHATCDANQSDRTW
jgi:hypothetical protein